MDSLNETESSPSEKCLKSARQIGSDKCQAIFSANARLLRPAKILMIFSIEVRADVRVYLLANYFCLLSANSVIKKSEPLKKRAANIQKSILRNQQMRVAEIKSYLAQFFNSVEVIGNEGIEIERVAKIESATSGEIAFVANPKYEKYLSQTNASAVIISNKMAYNPPKENQAFITMDDAYTGFVFVLEKLMPKRERLEAGIHPTAVVQSPISQSVSVGANVFIGKNCTIGERVQLYPNVVILDECTIDDDCIIYPNTTIYSGTKIGKRVIMHSGCVIGADGFGFAPQRDGSHKKIPQIGIVVIEDDVEIGANTCIDRATLGETRIEQGVKLDNLIQVAHNVVIGKHTVIAAQTGISGSTKIGEQCMIAGQAGFVGHIKIGNKITIGAQSGIAKSFLKEGDFLRGTPARPLREQLRQEAYQANLKNLFEKVKQLEKALNDLKQGNETAL